MPTYASCPHSASGGRASWLTARKRQRQQHDGRRDVVLQWHDAMRSGPTSDGKTFVGPRIMDPRMMATLPSWGSGIEQRLAPNHARLSSALRGHGYHDIRIDLRS